MHTAPRRLQHRVHSTRLPDGADHDLEEGADEIGDPRQLGDLFVGREAFQVGSADGDALFLESIPEKRGGGEGV